MQAKSLFTSKTFQGATISLLTCLAPIIISCIYNSRIPSEKESITITGAIITYCWSLIGRMQTSPTYTPSYLPGANKKDFENNAPTNEDQKNA